MKMSKLLAASAAAIAIATASGGIAHAQTTTSDIRGVVTDSSGAPISGAAVTIRDELTGSSRTVSTGANGNYSARGLNTAGRYTVRVDTDRFTDESVTDIVLSLGDTTVIDFDLSGSASGDEIVVVATRSSAIEVATGPAATFGFSDLQTGPALSRDIKDIIRTDPRLFIEESNGNGLQCAGASPRFNSLTVDGVKLNDNFGLNSNGYPTERLPFPFDAIDQVAVELAPFDVEYGGFTGCNINAVTRSGSNEFHGSAWVDYTTDSFRGNSIEGSEFDNGDYSETRFGATLSGPIIKDRLFLFAAYEKTNEAEIIARGPAELGAIGVQGVTQAQLDRIFDIARTVWEYDPLPLPTSFGEDDEKILAKLDWNITDNHRASFTYNRTDGNNLTASDSDPDEYEVFDHYYLRSTLLNSYSGQIFSNWSDNFSTEVRVSYTINDTGQNSINGTDFGEIQIRTYNPATGEDARVYLGTDDSRQSNKLDTKTLNMKFKADYASGDHLFSFGFEREDLEIFNLFVQHTESEIRFDRLSGSSLAADPEGNIDDFEIQFADDLYYGNAGGTNVPADAAANFSFATNTVYAQDKFTVGDSGMTITAGLRYDWYTSGDVPTENANFVARNGFANTATFSGKGLLQPRFGFNYEAKDNLTFRGGLGIFSGGNPNVWLANSFQNDGVTTIQRSTRDIDLTALTFVEDEGGAGRPGHGVPLIFFDDVAAGSADSSTNAIDPNFSIPSQWKGAFGATYHFDLGGFGSDYTFNADFLYTKDRVAATVIDATLAQVDTGPDGRPLYRRVDFSDPLCATDPENCTGRGFSQDFLLSNNQGGSQRVLSAALSKDYEFAGGWDLDWTLAYAHTYARDRNPMTSSVAFSNFVFVSTTDPNNPSLGISNYQVPHRLTFRAGLRKAFFGDYETRFNLVGVASQSRPYSINFIDGGDLFGDRLDGRHLAYIPSSASDPNVIFSSDFNGAANAGERDAQIAAFFAASDGLGLERGMVASRNGIQSDWFSQWDLRIEQQIPGIFDGHKASAFIVLDKIGNMLNDKWGVINQAGFPGAEEFLELDESGLGPNGEYILTGFDNITPDTIQTPVLGPSVWEIRFGLKYEF